MSTNSWILGLSLLGAIACSGDTEATDGTTPGDTDGVTDLYGDCHPLIGEYLIGQGKDPLNPSENSLCYELNTTEPCTKRGGAPGTRVYRFMDDGRVVDGNFTGTERWFWFRGDVETWDEDVVDLLSYSGTASDTISGADLSCVGCEEIYELTRTVEENNTGTPYSTEIVFALDNLNPNGGWQGGEDERNMFVFYARYRRGELTNLDTDYAKGQYTPDSMVPGEFPATYTWFPQGPSGKCY